MKENLILEDKNYISAKRASETFGYSSDYIGQLCRGKKLECKMIGRSWFITKESLVKYQNSVSDKNSNSNTAPQVSKDQNSSYEITSSPMIVSDVVIGDIENDVEDADDEIEQENIVKTDVLDFSNPAPVVVKKPTHKQIKPTQIKLKKFNHAVVGSVFPKHKRNTSSRLTLATAVSIVAIFFTLQSFYPNAKFFVEVATYSNSIVETISKNIDDLPNYYANIFSGAKDVVVNKFNGFVVALSSKSPTQDQITINNIRNSFSDEVNVVQDIDGLSGVITPVFKKSTGDNFLYVMVPVKDNN